MAIELYPSSFRCDCGHESDFSENTVKEMKKMSKKTRVRLSGDDNKHTIIFYKGEAKEVICPKLGTCAITDSQ
jgi:predicted nucleotidyltransferase